MLLERVFIIYSKVNLSVTSVTERCAQLYKHSSINLMAQANWARRDLVLESFLSYLPIVVKTVRENIMAAENVQIVSPTSLPVYPLRTLLTVSF